MVPGIFPHHLGECSNSHIMSSLGTAVWTQNPARNSTMCCSCPLYEANPVTLNRLYHIQLCWHSYDSEGCEYRLLHKRCGAEVHIGEVHGCQIAIERMLQASLHRQEQNLKQQGSVQHWHDDLLQDKRVSMPSVSLGNSKPPSLATIIDCQS